VIAMATASFDKNIVIREKEAVSKLVDIGSSKQVGGYTDKK